MKCYNLFLKHRADTGSDFLASRPLLQLLLCITQLKLDTNLLSRTTFPVCNARAGAQVVKEPSSG